MKMFVISVLNGFCFFYNEFSLQYQLFCEVRNTRFKSVCFYKTLLPICKKQIYGWRIVRIFEASLTPTKSFGTVNIAKSFKQFSRMNSNLPWSKYYHNSSDIHPDLCSGSVGGERYYFRVYFFFILTTSNMLSTVFGNISLISMINGFLHFKLIEQSLIRLPVLSP